MAVSQRQLARGEGTRRLARRLSLAALAAVAAVVIYAFYLQVGGVLDLRAQQRALAQRVAALGAQNAALQQRLALQNNPDYLEYLARKELGLVKPGEVKVILPHDAP